MNCRHLLDALSDYLDDQAAASLRADLEAHLAECRSCTVIVETSRRTLRIVTDVGSFEIPDELSERLLRKTMAGLASARGGASDPGAGDPEPGGTKSGS
ncbi:MAG TPA: zf-HC2 domain-containing protein [Verrucomicrobiae bacterium]|nr:zf-HC2 domain-containing protein [Verrucomicrobiae bacterium]